jgi:hypothetical protein
LQELCITTDPKYKESVRSTLIARYATFKSDWDAAMYGGSVSVIKVISVISVIKDWDRSIMYGGSVSDASKEWGCIEMLGGYWVMHSAGLCKTPLKPAVGRVLCTRKHMCDQ